MSVDLESQIRLIADAAFDETSAVDVDRRAIATAATPAETIDNQEPVMLKPRTDPSPSPRRTRMLAIAASVVVVIAGVVAIALLRDDSGEEPADPPVPSTTVATSTTTTPTTVAAVDTAALAAIGEQLMTAFDARDTDTVAALVADDATPISMIGVSTKSGLIDLFGYIEAADLGFDLQECVGSEPDQVQCTVLQSSGFATAARVPPGEATMLLKIEDGQIIALRYGRPEGHGFAHDRFSAFIRESDPEAVTKMWWSTSTGEPYALLTEESFELFEKYTQEFLDARS